MFASSTSSISIAVGARALPAAFVAFNAVGAAPRPKNAASVVSGNRFVVMPAPDVSGSPYAMRSNVLAAPGKPISDDTISPGGFS